MQKIIDACKARGLSVTYQRIAILKSLQERNDHPTAEDIYQEIKKTYPTISLATVYKTLETFARHDIIHKVNRLHDMARYDGNNANHHHMVCVECKKIYDFQSENLNNLELPSSNFGNFKVSSYQVQFEGLCEQCQ
ncbi:MAG: transcriptional repressor [Calditrichales bacterium]|nr:MAG: transcriptional repressor [Calditrichales bacterium]